MTSRRVVATVRGKHVTAMMMTTLASLSEGGRPFATMSAMEMNRVRALQDKGLATIRAGQAVPTNAGLTLLVEKRAEP